MRALGEQGTSTGTLPLHVSIISNRASNSCPQDDATDAIRFHRKFVRPDAHASAIRTAGQLYTLVVERFVLTAAETIDRFPVQLPRVPCIVDHGERQVVMLDILFDVPAAGESILDQFSCRRLVAEPDL